MPNNIYLIPTVLAADTQHDHLAPIIKDIVSNTKVYWVEDIRTARRYISSLRLGLVIEDLIFEVLNKKTSISEVNAFFKKYAKEDIGIISEAGCPGIADPGSLAVKVAHEKNIPVIPLPGPSSIFMALMGSGFNGQRFTFNGYIPINLSERKKEIKRLESLALNGTTQIFMETPYRNNQLMKDLIAHCHGDTMLSISCNISAPNELVKTKRIKDWNSRLPDLHKLPTIFLLNQN